MQTVFSLNRPTFKSILSIIFVFVWLINGLICKVLNFVPRHQQIVSQILGQEYGFIATKTIGVLEILMAVWIFSRIKFRWCSLTQMIVVATMNVIEFILVPDLLLFGKLNAIVALAFIVIVYLNEFVFDS